MGFGLLKIMEGQKRMNESEAQLKRQIEVSLTEKQFQQQVIDLAKLCGWKEYHTWKSIHSPAGFPDLILVRDCAILAVEVKSEKGKLTEAQWDWLEALGKTGVKVYIWKPSNWEEVVECLQDDKTIT